MYNAPIEARLTGRTKYRCNWFGRLILQVEVLEVRRDVPGVDVFAEVEWRDAKVGDFNASPGLFKVPPMPYPGQKPATERRSKE